MARKNYKQFGITRKEKEAEMYDILLLQDEILALKKRDLGKLMCERCSSEEDLQIHHKRYGPDVNYYDLELLCRRCHLEV